ncbi:hypothetical protein M0R45_006826 [Rubus argutus]|uniref:Uncharacterized protein n=1 Tax=Rubus argutus TaxID=59490 RepID=A0AAW1YSA4_RUBAR
MREKSTGHRAEIGGALRVLRWAWVAGGLKEAGQRKSRQGRDGGGKAARIYGLNSGELSWLNGATTTRGRGLADWLVAHGVAEMGGLMAERWRRCRERDELEVERRQLRAVARLGFDRLKP